MFLRNLVMWSVPVLLLATSAYAEAIPKHEFSVGLGTWSSVYASKKANKWLDATLDDKWSGGDGSTVNNNGMESNAITKMGYNYRVKDSLLITVAATSQNYKDDYKTGKINSLLLGVRHEYVHINSEGVYSGVSVGQATEKYNTATTYSKSKTTAFQIDALGYRFSKGVFSGYLSVGIGYEGIIQGGISVRL